MSPHKPLRPFTIDHFKAYAANLILDSGAPWLLEDFQAEMVSDLFAGTPEIWTVIPEANGKSTLLAGVSLYHSDYTPSAEVLMAASSRDQCAILFNQAAGFVYRSPGMNKRFKVLEGYRRVNALETHGRIQVHAADDRTGDGVLYSLALVDELHRHRDMRLYRTWRGKLGKRNGQIWTISTAGEPGTEFEISRERQRTEAVDITTNGRHIRAASEEMVLHDFALRTGDDPEDLALVKEANPFSGVTPETLRRKRASVTMTAGHWRRFVCNLATRTEGAAVGEAEWLDAEAPDPGLGGRRCEVGLDLGWKIDATALVPLFQTPDGWLLGRSRVMVPPRDGNSLDPQRVMDEIRALHAETPIDRLVMDPSAGGEQLHFWIEQELGVEVVSHSQKTAPMSLAASRFMEALRDGTLRHVADPVLTRHVLNAVARDLPDGTFKFERPVSSRSSQTEAPRREIDALIAASMVFSVASGGSSYDGPLLEVLS